MSETPDTLDIHYRSERVLLCREVSCGLASWVVFVLDKDPTGAPYYRYEAHARDTDHGHRALRALIQELTHTP